MLQPQLALPPRLPVMVLAGCNLLPHGLLPLYIFEPKYRQMLADALDGGRMFAIGTVGPATDLSAAQPLVREHSSAGLVRACVGAPDGSSHLLLQGVQRVRFTSWLEDDDKPYRVATIEPIPTSNHHPETALELADRALELARELVASGQSTPSPLALEEIESLGDPDPIADMVAYHLIRDPYRRHALLEMEDVGERLRFLIAQLADTGSTFP